MAESIISELQIFIITHFQSYCYSITKKYFCNGFVFVSLVIILQIRYRELLSIIARFFIDCAN